MANNKRKSYGKTKTFYISTIISISLVLLMIGLLGLFLIHAKNLSDYVKENIVLSVIVRENVSEAEILKLQKQIDGEPSVKSTQYVSKDMAAVNLQKDLGEDFVKFLGYNPLLSSIDIYLKAGSANKETIDSLQNNLVAKEMVKEVFYQESLVDVVNKNSRLIGIVILSFGVILLLISIALINNTIRLAMYSQRFLIKSMQLVGATKNFIRKPFLLTGIMHGVFGALISIILLILLLFWIRNAVPELVILQNYLEFAFIFALVLVSGALISFLSTYMAVTKYLNQKVSDLYN